MHTLFPVILLALTSCAQRAVVKKVPAKTIHRAAELGDSRALKSFLAKGISPDAPDLQGLTPLHWASDLGHKEIASLLISAGARVNAQNSEGLAPLHMASAGGKWRVGELLINKGAKLNIRERRIGTYPPLHRQRLGQIQNGRTSAQKGCRRQRPQQ